MRYNTSIKLIGPKGKELILKDGENVIYFNDLMSENYIKKNFEILTIYLINYKSALIRTYKTFPVTISDCVSMNRETFSNDSLLKYNDLKSIKIIPSLFKKALYEFKDYEQEIHFIEDTSVEEPEEGEKKGDLKNTRPIKLSNFIQSLSIEKQSCQYIEPIIKVEPFPDSSQDSSD